MFDDQRVAPRRHLRAVRARLPRVPALPRVEHVDEQPGVGKEAAALKHALREGSREERFARARLSNSTQQALQHQGLRQARAVGSNGMLLTSLGHSAVNGERRKRSLRMAAEVG